ncbi:hypothetical protein CNR22_24325 [Sphingobacteriaceae bacterium]|nr:hypothetical protein CNR22_24325 [Sphingobacteriaceae bacterium]
MSNRIGYFSAYKDMISFLDKYYEKTKLDDLGGVLGSMDYEIFSGGEPIDTALKPLWIDIIKKKIYLGKM